MFEFWLLNDTDVPGARASQLVLMLVAQGTQPNVSLGSTCSHLIDLRLRAPIHKVHLMLITKPYEIPRRVLYSWKERGPEWGTRLGEFGSAATAPLHYVLSF